MKIIFNIIRLLLYIPLSLALLWLMYIGFGYLIIWLSHLSLIAILLVLFFASSLLVGISVYLFGYLAALLSMLNPYKKIGGWIVIPIAILLAVFNIISIWKEINLSYSKELIIGLVISGLIIYTTVIFCVCISSNSNSKEIFG